MSWIRWNWLENVVLPLAMVILRFCWLWPWFALAQRWLAPSYQGTLMPEWLVIGLLVGGMAVTHWVLQQVNTLTQARVAAAGAGLAIVFLGLWWQFFRLQYPLWDVRWVDALGQKLIDWGNDVPPPFLFLLGTAYLWLRGMQDGRKVPLVREDIWRACTAGGIALVALMLASMFDGRGLPDGTGSLVLLFFATGLGALAIASLEMASRSGGRRFEAQLRLDRYWLGSVVSVIAVLLGLGLLLGALIAPETVAQVLSGIWVVARQALLYLIMAISLILYPIFYLLSIVLPPFLTRLFALFNRIQLPVLLPPGAWEPGGQPSGEAVSIVDRIPAGVRWLALAVLPCVIGLAFARALRRLLVGEREIEGIEEVREMILSRGLLQEQLARLWRDWLNWLRRGKPEPSLFLSLEGEPPTRYIVRAVYQALLAATQKRELPRLRHQTPIEYRRGLEAELSAATDSLGVITGRYVQARYDSVPPTVEQAERTLEAWERLKTTLEPQSGDEAG